MPFNPTDPSGPYPIKGIVLDSGETPGIRKELRDFKQNKDLWNLYLLGLWQFQLVPKDKQLSYFQIAGIHGRPYTAWPPSDEELNGLKKETKGFCTHTSILFLTWHRPYLALFESILQQAILYVANQYTAEEGKERYLAAAKEFRMPYWDWARPDLPVFPDEATDSNVSNVIIPESLRAEYPDLDRQADGTVQIPNPLFSYKFPPLSPEDEKIFKIEERPGTTRYHATGVSADLTPEEQKQALIDSITPFTRDVNKELPVEGNLRERVVYLLKSYENFDQVSHNQWDPNRVPADDEDGNPSEIDGLGFGSMEDIHNTVHVLVGGQGEDAAGRNRDGHMTHVPISAFDPIFWLHHTNIDRLSSIWQGLHEDPNDKDTWVTEKTSLFGSWSTARGTNEGPDTALTPFYKDTSNFWNSEEVRDTALFGYAYPETKSWTFANQADYRNDIGQQLLTLYPSGSLATMLAASKAGDDTPEATLRKRAKKLARVDAVSKPSTALTALSLAKAVSTAPKSELAEALPPVAVPNIEVPDDRSLVNLVKNNSYLEWLVNIKAVKHALDGQYLIHIFLGRVPEEEATCLYSVSPYHIGTFSPLGQSTDTGCEKCKSDQEANTEITGQIPLTIALAERYFAGELDSIQEDDVIAYLQKNLHWEVVDKGGQRLQSRRHKVDGLLVGVVSNEVTLPEGDYEHPRYSSKIKLYPTITTKQDGENGRAEGTGITEDNKYFY